MHRNVKQYLTETRLHGVLPFIQNNFESFLCNLEMYKHDSGYSVLPIEGK